MAELRTCARCRSAVCDGRTVSCLGCGTTQCHGNGLGKGSCSVCHFGILPGWSSWDKRCGYKGCGNRAAFHYVPGTVKYVCHDHATRPKVGVTGGKLTLADYTRKHVADAWRARGVVGANEPHTPRALFLSADVDCEIADMVVHARRTYQPEVQHAERTD